MPLTPGSLLRYDAARMALTFTMMNPQGGVIRCTISAAAMDELDGPRRRKGFMPKDREVQFEELRPRIEAMASKMFDNDTSGRDTVHIFYHHVWSGNYRAAGSAANNSAGPSARLADDRQSSSDVKANPDPSSEANDHMTD